MPQRRSIQPPLSIDDLERRYRTATAPVARSHWQMVWLLAQGQASEQGAASIGYSVTWLRMVAQRDNQYGPSGLGDRRPRNPGSPGLLAAEQRAALVTALERPPPDGGVWTGPKVAAWMAATLGHVVHPQRGWDMLQRLGLRPKVPRPRHAKADPAAQAAFKKSFPPWSRRSGPPTPRTW
jgi:transposase